MQRERDAGREREMTKVFERLLHEKIEIASQVQMWLQLCHCSLVEMAHNSAGTFCSFGRVEQAAAAFVVLWCAYIFTMHRNGHCHSEAVPEMSACENKSNQAWKLAHEIACLPCSVLF